MVAGAAACIVVPRQRDASPPCLVWRLDLFAGLKDTHGSRLDAIRWESRGGIAVVGKWGRRATMTEVAVIASRATKSESRRVNPSRFCVQFAQGSILVAQTSSCSSGKYRHCLFCDDGPLFHPAHVCMYIRLPVLLRVGLTCRTSAVPPPPLPPPQGQRAAGPSSRGCLPDVSPID